jgi:MerR family transcriptional regulator, light-induced transcriptional regulator
VTCIRTLAAAELLEVSPGILRSWEERFGYPKPRRSAGGQRRYELAEVEGLRRALLETHSVATAIERARRRGIGPRAPARLVDAFMRFDEEAADRVMEESLVVRSFERSVDDVLIPAFRAAAEREDADAEFQLARQWSLGWLYAAIRAVPHPDRERAVLLFDASAAARVESVQLQALQLGLRRAGVYSLVFPFELPPRRPVRAIRALMPVAIVVCGSAATEPAIARFRLAVAQGGSATPVLALGSAGFNTVQAVAYVKGHLEDGCAGIEHSATGVEPARVSL